jgi:hypothetical protein
MILKAINTRIVPNGQPSLRYPMISYANLTDTELKATYTSIRPVPAIKNKVERKFADE